MGILELQDAKWQKLNKVKAKAAGGMLGGVASSMGLKTKQERAQEILKGVDNSNPQSVMDAFTRIRDEISPELANSFYAAAKPMMDMSSTVSQNKAATVTAEARALNAKKSTKNHFLMGVLGQPNKMILMTKNDQDVAVPVLNEQGEPSIEFKHREQRNTSVDTVYNEATGRAETIPGSPRDKEEQAERGQKKQQKRMGKYRLNTITKSVNNAMDILDKAENLSGWDENKPWNQPQGVGGQTTGWIWGSEGAKLRAELKTIKGNIAFDRLQKMREASPTGGALGNVSNIELEMLASVMSNLEQSQTPDQLFENLAYIDALQNMIIHGSEDVVIDGVTHKGHPLPARFDYQYSETMRAAKNTSSRKLGGKKNKAEEVTAELQDNIDSIMGN